jgi:beta-lactamase regulating signal transducer with metallopeptidase domain
MNMPLWLSNLLFWSVQVAALVLAAGFLPRLLKIRQPGVLLAYWRALLAVSLALPFFQPWHRLQGTGAIAATPGIVGENANARAILTASPATTHWQLPSVEVFASIVGSVLLVGIAARFVILAVGLLKLRQFRRGSSPISQLVDCVAVLEEMRARVHTRAEFRISTDVDSPVTFGFTSPVILLPERFPRMDEQFQAAIACHELLHVRRRDWVHHLAEEIIRTALWFHPAIAWLIGRVRLAREQVVDHEVVRLTKAPKPYVEALLEIMASRTLSAAIPAPPFLVERQLAERVALMLKEVRMSRTRLIASLITITCCLALTVTLAAWAFPLKVAPLPAQNPPQTGVTQGISGGVTGGVNGGVAQSVSGGAADGIRKQNPAQGVKNGVSGGASSSALVTRTYSDTAPSQQPQKKEQTTPKIVVGDIKFEGEVRDVDAVRARILKRLERIEFDGKNSEWLDEVAEVYVRGEFQNHGYFEARVGAVTAQPIQSAGQQQRMLVIVPITEGDQFTAGDISIVSGDPGNALAIPEEELRQQIHLAKGELLNLDELRAGIEKMVRLFGARGFMDMNIEPELTADYKNHSVAVTMHVHQGRKYLVDKFEVRGLDSVTKDRLESKLRPGSIFDNSLLPELFNQGKSALGRDVSSDDVVHVNRNVEKGTVEILFDFSAGNPRKN